MNATFGLTQKIANLRRQVVLESVLPKKSKMSLYRRTVRSAMHIRLLPTNKLAQPRGYNNCCILETNMIELGRHTAS